jgi:polysaccharide export outer membrane protein
LGQGRKTIRFHRAIAGFAFAFIGCVAALFFSACSDPWLSVPPENQAPKSQTPFVPTNYLIGPGDELEVLYQFDPGFTVDDYMIDTQDTLRIEYYYYPVMTRNVRVRPDGRVTLPLIGDVMAKGQKPSALAKTLAQLYQPHLKRPDITVEVETFHAKVAELKEAITTTTRGQSRVVVVRPDGGISLPFVGDITASRLTAVQLSMQLHHLYRKVLENLSVTVAVLGARSNKVYLLGQVEKPDMYDLIGPTTLTQIVARAGGFTRDANMEQVVVISRRADGRPEAAVLDLKDMISQGNLAQDVFLKQYDVVYVPRTKLAQAALVGDQLWRLIPLTFSINGSYSLGGVAPE